MIKMFIFTTSEAITDNPTVIDLMDTIAKLTKIVEDLKASSAANNKAIEQNTKRHENVDFSLNNLCSLIDEIFDADNHPGSTKYDCSMNSTQEHKVRLEMLCFALRNLFCQYQDCILHQQQGSVQPLAENYQSTEKKFHICSKLMKCLEIKIDHKKLLLIKSILTINSFSKSFKKVNI